MADITRREHVFRDVMGALLAAAILGAAGYATWALGWLGKVWEWLVEPVTVSRGWWYVLHGVVVFAVLGFVVGWVRRARFEHAEYREDDFFGMRWRWAWDWTGGVTSLYFWCPRCDRRAVYDISKDDMFRPQVTVFCQECQVPHTRPGTLDQLLGCVQREIELKVRNGSWKQVIANQRPGGKIS
jgi:hypothetical protein